MRKEKGKMSILGVSKRKKKYPRSKSKENNCITGVSKREKEYHIGK